MYAATEANTFEIVLERAAAHSSASRPAAVACPPEKLFRICIFFSIEDFQSYASCLGTIPKAHTIVKMVPRWLLFALAVALAASHGVAAATFQSREVDPPPCNFSGYIDHPNVTSWEFQLDVPPDKCIGLQRNTMLEAVATALVQLAQNNSSLADNVKLDESSLRTSVFDQVETAVGTRDGRPLSGKSANFPWFGPAFLRYRVKYASWHGKQSSTQPSSTSVSVQPGTGDLTLKVKDVDLDTFEPLHEVLNFRRHARHCGQKNKKSRKRPHLKWKIENDRYCAQGMPSYEANYHPVKFKSTDSVRYFKPTEQCFHGLWEFLKINQGLALPEYSDPRAFAKSVWDIEINGLPGVVNWVATYPTLLDALTGGETAAACELSLRVKRASADGKGGENQLKDALKQVVLYMETLHDNGWDTGVHSTRPSQVQ